MSVFGIYALGTSGLILCESLVAKVRDREAILNFVKWKGSESVLDVGCGRGLMLVGAARRLTTGRATDVDIWARKDKALHKKSAPAENARAEGKGKRGGVETADMRKLPFANLQFDVVVSDCAVHKLKSKAYRLQAIIEMDRVLRPNEVILLSDIINRNESVAAFQSLGFADVRLIVLSPVKDRLFTLVSFGFFRPATVVARRHLSR